MRSILFAAVLLSTPALAFESTSASEQAEIAQPDVAKEEKKICKRIDATESRLASKRVCMTAAEWKKAGRTQN